jgi:hypothetical protein
MTYALLKNKRLTFTFRGCGFPHAAGPCLRKCQRPFSVPGHYVFARPLW